MIVLSVNIFVTNNCNMRCEYCYESPESREQMDLNIAGKLVDYICDIIKTNHTDMLKLQFHGGEPLLALPVIERLLSSLKVEIGAQCKIITGLTTNGTIMSEEIISFIINNIDLISISIDGMKDSHNTNRRMVNGCDSFDIVWENAMTLLQRCPNLTARMTVAKNTVPKVAENVKYLAEKGFKTISPELDFTEKCWTEADVDMYCYGLEKAYKYIQEQNINATITAFDNTEKSKKGSKCLGGTDSISIDIDGTIYPCLLVTGNKEWVIGSIFTGVDIDFASRLESIVDKDNDVCKGCARLEYCEGNRCKIINKQYTGNYHMPFPMFCTNENICFRLCQIKNERKEEAKC